MDDVTRAMSKGGVLVNSGGVFQIDDVTRAMSKGGGACECPRVGSFFKLMTSHGQCPRGGGACECPRVGAFFKLMTSRGQCPRGGGAPGVPPTQVQTPPTWLAGYGPAYAA